jgi:hypothetical protein
MGVISGIITLQLTVVPLTLEGESRRPDCGVTFITNIMQH